MEHQPIRAGGQGPNTERQQSISLYPTHLRIGVYRVTQVALEAVELAAFSTATLRGAFGWSVISRR